MQVYVKDFGKNKEDLCLVAQVSDKIVGAVWVRIMNDYGHIDNETPSFAISLLKEYRNYGIGTELPLERWNVLFIRNVCFSKSKSPGVSFL